MPTKVNNAGEQQEYDASTGRYGKGTSSKRDYDSEIKALKDKTVGLSLFSPERHKLTEQIRQLEAEKEGFSSYDDLSEYRHNLFVQKQPPKQEAKENKPINKPVSEHQQKQFEIIQEFNPMQDDYHTGIRKASEIKTPQEAFIEESGYPDFTKEDMKKALEKGTVTIYSSKPISQGGFVSPSKMMAQDYAGSGKIYSMEANINDVAWIDSAEGQYAKVKNYLNDYIKNNKNLNNFDEKTRNNFIENFKKMPKNQQYYYSLPKQEQFALSDMQMGTRIINEYMSGRNKDFDAETKKELDEKIKNVKSAINKYDLEQPITLYRGVSKEEFDDIKDGGKTTSFKSASTDEKRAEAFAKNQGGYIIEYHAGKGSRVADVNGVPRADENEYLIDSDVKYKKITKNGNRIIVEI